VALFACLAISVEHRLVTDRHMTMASTMALCGNNKIGSVLCHSVLQPMLPSVSVLAKRNEFLWPGR